MAKSGGSSDQAVYRTVSEFVVNLAMTSMAAASARTIAVIRFLAVTFTLFPPSLYSVLPLPKYLD
jgi:hypothetical protein